MGISCRAQNARNSAEAAETKAKEAQTLSNHAREVAKEFAPEFLQLGIFFRMIRLFLGLSIINKR